MKLRPFDNVFENDEAYKEHKKKFIMDTTNAFFERNAKEAYKCTCAGLIMNLLESVGYMNNGIEFPEYIINGLENGKLPFVAQTVCCIVGYANNPNPVYCQTQIVYPKKLYKNRNRRFSVYYKNILKAMVKEWYSYKNLVDDDTFKRYKAALIVLRVFLRVFYFKALPKVLDEKSFNMCVSECREFSNYYKIDNASGKYLRKRFIRKAALLFNDNVAWSLVYNELYRFKLVA